MTFFETVAVAFSMFSALPMPQVDWNERNMRYSLCAFPLVGVLIGLCCWGWSRVCTLVPLPPLLCGAGLCLIPVWITGGIHLDGYADTCDALASHAGVEKRQEILKDPHLGTFAVIRLCCWFLADFALWCTLQELRVWTIIGIFGLSRSLSGLSLTSFPLREGSGLARSFAEAADRARVRRILIGLCIGFAALLSVSGGWPCIIVATFVFLYYRRLCVKDFGGLSGDLAGWFLQTAELWMLGALVLWQILKGLL